MNILHLASFRGNIGDNASHQGLVEILGPFFGSYNVTRLEIRKFYNNYTDHDKGRFDQDFVSHANKFDLFIVGGGGFLDCCIPGSPTGATFALPPELVGKLTVPTLLTSIGAAPRETIPEGNLAKFRNFIDRSLENPFIRIAVRNDGSASFLRENLGSSYLEVIPEILDNGFFYQSTELSDLPVGPGFAAINIASDQIRTARTSNRLIAFPDYYTELRKALGCILDHGLDLVLIPHIHSDLQEISAVLATLGDSIVRDRVTVAPCIQGDAGAKYLFSLYQKSRLVIGTRFHANVCSLAMGRPTIGLAALDRVRYMFGHVGMDNRCIDLNEPFSAPLTKLINSELTEHLGSASGRSQIIDSKRKETLATYKMLFSHLNLLGSGM